MATPDNAAARIKAVDEEVSLCMRRQCALRVPTDSRVGIDAEQRSPMGYDASPAPGTANFTRHPGRLQSGPPLALRRRQLFLIR